MNRKCLLYSTRAFLGSEGTSVASHLCLLKKHFGVIDFLTKNKTKRSIDFIEKSSNIRIRNSIIEVSEFYKEQSFTSWEDFYQKIDVSEFKDYDALIIVGGLFSPGSGLIKHSKRNGVFPKDSGQIKFKSVGIHCANILAMLKAHREFKIPLHEVCFDPLEFSLNEGHDEYLPLDNYYLYHGYDIPQYDMKRLDSLQYNYLNNIKNHLFLNEPDKIYDFTFGYTIMNNGNRGSYTDDVKDLTLTFETNNLYIRDLHNSTFLDKTTYLDKIAHSLYTMILPAYDESAFSISRFVESLNLNCLPLIHSACNLKDVEKSFDVDLGPLILRNNRLPFDYSERRFLLDEYKQKFLEFKCDFAI